MTVPCETREERIAIRMDSGISENEAIAMTDADSLVKRIAALAAHQREHAAPVSLAVPAHEPILTAKDMAAGEVA